MDLPVTTTIGAERLRTYIADIFAAAGVGRDEAARIALHLVSSNLAGHDSHGVIRVPRYVSWVQDGTVRPGQSIRIVKDSDTHALIDGNRGFGQSIGEQAVDLGIAKARKNGIAIILLRNTGHLGRIGGWGERAAEAGLTSIHFVNVAGSLLVAPFAAAERRFATNPICIAVPLPEGGLLLLDFATSMVAEGKVLVASNGGKKLPEGALIDADGNLSSDPRALYGDFDKTGIRDSINGRGGLRTFGEHKGSGLAFMCEVLAGCLSGGNTAGERPPDGGPGILNNMLSIYLDPQSFGAAHFAQTARDFAETVKSARPAERDGEVLVPGEPEARNRAKRLAEGIPLQADTWSSIVETGRALGVEPPP